MSVRCSFCDFDRLIGAAPRAATEPRTFDDDETWDWGIVIDALVEHRTSAEARKRENPESNSDVRADICKRMIEAIVADADARYQRGAAPRAATEPDPRIWDDGYAQGFATAQNIAAATEPHCDFDCDACRATEESR